MSGLVKWRNKVRARPVGFSTHTDSIFSSVMISPSTNQISSQLSQLLFVTMVSNSASASASSHRASTSSALESSSYLPNAEVVRKCLLTALASSYSLKAFCTRSSCIFIFATCTSNSP
ncbi:hypothetical protein KC19_VG227000 [Ceratodon purpureus]|uniref:Uncharacterized protein n=1 Tax=Ceratodon purpureus TaxID=3225 RepID=A0A8T0HST3_CERPU|nr:hypothetical protein KC19_VG227000 [Ceratodon purpureus]